MRLLLDECADVRLKPYLAHQGHDVETVVDLDPSGDDLRLLALALAEDRVLITTDLDFGELLVREQRESVGVVLLRLEGVPPAAAAERICQALDRHATMLRGHLVVIDGRRDRLRQVRGFGASKP